MSLAAAVGLTLGDLCLDVELQIDDDAVVAVVGPNGAGKTTLLRALAGLVPLERGRVVLGGALLEDASACVRVAPEARRVGVIFAEHRLFAHLSALDNVAFGLRAHGRPRRPARVQAQSWLDRVGIGDLAGRRPSELSGGQAQRVALARALATEPALLLCDEPLAAVDASARDELRQVLRTELRRYPGVRILVTHDPVEAATLADRLVVIEDGRVTQDGPLVEVTARPRSKWIATMVGLNLLQGTAESNSLRLPGGEALVTATPLWGPAFAAFRPNAVTLHRHEPEGSARNTWSGQASELYVSGDRARVRVAGPVPLIAEVTAAAVAELHLGDAGTVWASVKATDIDVYPA